VNVSRHIGVWHNITVYRIVQNCGEENFGVCSIPVLWQEVNFGESSFVNSLK